MNIVFITSIIHTIDAPLSYISTRSVYTPEERFQQTLITIESIKKYIPDAYIILIEVSKIDEQKEKLFCENVNMYLNYSDDEVLRTITDGRNKSYAEGSIILKFLESNEFTKLEINNLFKLSGRYFLNDNFVLDKYINDSNCFKQIIDGSWYTSVPCYYSSFYKINKQYINEYINILKNNIIKLETIRDRYHSDMEHFLCTYFKENIEYIDTLGISGNIAVTGSLVTY